MNTNHSPGPWVVTDGHYPCFREVCGASFRISAVMSASDLTEDDYRRRSADPRLIAAAPLLLDALQDMLIFDNGKPEFDAARAAIAAAT